MSHTRGFRESLKSSAHTPPPVRTRSLPVKILPVRKPVSHFGKSSQPLPLPGGGGVVTVATALSVCPPHTWRRTRTATSVAVTGAIVSVRGGSGRWRSLRSTKPQQWDKQTGQWGSLCCHLKIYDNKSGDDSWKPSLLGLYKFCKNTELH